MEEKIVGLRAHNGSIVRINIDDEICQKLSGFKHLDIIAKENKIAIFIGVGNNPFSLQREAWKMEIGDLGITNIDTKKWHKAEAEEIIELFKTIKRQEILVLEYLDSEKAQIA